MNVDDLKEVGATIADDIDRWLAEMDRLRDEYWTLHAQSEGLEGEQYREIMERRHDVVMRSHVLFLRVHENAHFLIEHAERLKRDYGL